MKNYNELAGMNREHRFLEIFVFCTTGIKNEATLEATKQALLGNNETKIKELYTISELTAKGFLSFAQTECLIELARVTEK